MAGIYIHIPFCKTRCAYCDFYSTTQTSLRERYIQALCRELELRNGYLQGHHVHTVYFGGGTPSQLRPTDLERIFGLIYKVYGLEQCTEITLEANPDDLTDDYVAALARLPFNRVSMGIQTFHDPTLRLLNRRHTAAQAVAAVNRLRRAGIRNISIDLIYGLPGETQERWEADLRQALSLDVEHISAYLLTYEEGTPLYRMKQQGQVQEADEDSCLCFFTTLMDTLAANGYEHYEISNFCKPGFHSRHNSSYWQGTPYLGCGPSAHSYNGQTRSWNTPSIDRYPGRHRLRPTCIRHRATQPPHPLQRIHHDPSAHPPRSIAQYLAARLRAESDRLLPARRRPTSGSQQTRNYQWLLTLDPPRHFRLRRHSVRPDVCLRLPPRRVKKQETGPLNYKNITKGGSSYPFFYVFLDLNQEMTAAEEVSTFYIFML